MTEKKDTEEANEKLNEQADEQQADVQQTDAHQADVQQTKQRKAGKKSRTIRTVLLIILIILLALVLGTMLFRYLGQKKEADKYKKLKDQTTVTRKKDSKTDKTGHTKDFAELQKENPDIIAWLNVPGTDVDYPVLMSSGDEDTNYYLHHNVDKSSGYPGAIYIQKEQSKDFADFNMVLYGHNMHNGTMFASLHRFEDENFFKEHTTFTIETPTKLLTYQIYAAERFNDRLLISYYADANAGREQFLKDISSVSDTISHVNTDVSVSTEDKLVTLSTCIGREQSNRYLVIGKLVKAEDL